MDHVVRPQTAGGRLQWDVPMKIQPLSKATDVEAPPDAVLELACFVKPPRICFENVKVGDTKFRTLKIFNPGVEIETVVLEKFPSADAGFEIEGHSPEHSLCLQIEPQEEVKIKIAWRPTVAANSRHLAIFKWIGGQKLQVIILASSFDSNAGKKKKGRRVPNRKVLQPSGRSNIPVGRAPLPKPKLELPKHNQIQESPDAKSLVEILPDTPSRRTTFTVTHSKYAKDGEEAKAVSENKENAMPNTHQLFQNSKTFNVERNENPDEKKQTFKKSHQMETKANDEDENSPEDAKKNQDRFMIAKNDWQWENAPMDGNTFHESEIRLSSSPIRWYGGFERFTSSKSKDDLNPGQVVMNGEVKHEFIPYPSFNNTDTFLNMEMSTTHRRKVGYHDESLSFSSAASSLFTITREEKFLPHLETVNETSDFCATPKVNESKTLIIEESDVSQMEPTPELQRSRVADEVVCRNETFELSSKNGSVERENGSEQGIIWNGTVQRSNFDENAALRNADVDDETIRASIGNVTIPAAATYEELADEEVAEGVCCLEKSVSREDQIDAVAVVNEVLPVLVDEITPKATDIEEILHKDALVVKDRAAVELEEKASTVPVAEIATTISETGKMRPPAIPSNREGKTGRKKEERVVNSRYLTAQDKRKDAASREKKGRANELIKRRPNVVDVKFKAVTLPQKRKTDSSYSSRNIKPSLAIKKLKLNKPQEKIPRHPMPYAAKNMFYDERWIEKQERGFKNWLNFLLTPPEDEAQLENENSRGMLTLECDSNQPVAPTKEVLSFRLYAAKRRMARLRKEACMLYQCDQLASVIHKLEREIEHGRLAIRADRHVDADLGVRKHIADMLLSFSPLWLRIGLEVVFGEIIPMQNNDDVSSLSRFIHRRLLGNPDIAALYSHPSVPGLFKPGYVEALGKFTLKKLLLVIIYLDKAKTCRLISHDPCLFKKDSQFKSTRDMLLMFSKDYLHREGDLVKHLTYLGYSVSHVQTPLQEFDFGVNNLAADLRDGLRLVRVVELLTKNWNLSSKLRVPAVSRLQKVHNVEVAFQGLKDNHLDVNEGAKTDARYIVDGHREKTLHLLWQIIFHFQVEVLLDEQKLQDEIKHLERNRQLKRDYDALHQSQKSAGNKRDSLDNEIYSKSPKLGLLLKWCRLVGCLHGVKVENFTVSFSDGRALCYLLHHYHPALMPKQMVNDETSVTCGLSQDESDDDADVDGEDEIDQSLIYKNWTQSCKAHNIAGNRQFEKLLSNEKRNFNVFCEKVKEIGASPAMVLASDMSNTIPDEKVVIVYLSFLCSRLLDLREEIRAARCIQTAWRQHHLKEEKRKHKIRNTAAAKIQAAVRGFLLRKQQLKEEIVTVKIQAIWRGYAARKKILTERNSEMVQKRELAAKKIQEIAREFIKHKKQERQHKAATLLQTAVRRYLRQREQILQESAARKIQRHYRSWKVATSARASYIEKRNAVIKIQEAYRKYQSRRNERYTKAAVRIQTAWRMYFLRQKFSKKRFAAITIQKNWKAYTCKSRFKALRNAAGRLQVYARAYIIGSKAKKEFARKKNAVIILQKLYRDFVSRKVATREEAAVKLQSYVRMVKKRRQYDELRKTTMLLQSYVRRNIARRKYLRKRNAVVVIQQRFNAVKQGRKASDEYAQLRHACVAIQAATRAYQARQRYAKLRQNVIRIQALVRRKQCQDRFKKLKKSTVVLQRKQRAVAAGREVRKVFLAQKAACITIQSLVRGRNARKQYKALKNGLITIQAVWRGKKARRDFIAQRNAVIKIQAMFRAWQQMITDRNKFLELKKSCVVIQAGFRGSKQRARFAQLRQAAIKMQALHRGKTAKRRYERMQNAAVIIQQRYRANMVTKNEKKRYDQMRVSCVRIQSWYRSKDQEKKFKALKQAAIFCQSRFKCVRAMKKYTKEKAAALVIQRRYRSVKLAQAAQVHFLITRAAVISIQSAYRGYIVRRELMKLQEAATKIQALIRMHLAKREFQRWKNGAISLQRRFRATRKAKTQAVKYREMKKATVVLQAAFRGYLQRSEDLRMKQATTKIQALFRMYLARREFERQKRSVITLQRIIRATRKANIQAIRYNNLKNATIILQSAFRGYLERRKYLRIKQAATKIQALFRMHLARREFGEQKSGVIALQRRYRATREARVEAEKYREMKEATVVLQSAFRGYLKRREVHIMTQAATKIQASYRAFTARRKYANMRSAATVIVRNFRKLCDKRNKSAIKIQSWMRMILSRRKFIRQKNAAIVIQMHYRAYAAGLMQSVCYHIMRGAVITLQACIKGFLAQRKYQRKRKAVILMQAATRGYLCRKKYEALKRAVINMQERIRANAVGRVMRREFICKRSAVLTIQRALRRRNKLKEAATTIQTFYRAARDRRTFIKMRDSCLKIQRAFRRYQSRKEAATILQSYWRMHLAKKSYKQKKAAITIQTFYRAARDRRMFIKMRDSCLKIQRAFRRYQSRKEAAMTLQSNWRMHLARKSYKQKKAAITIQTFYRAARDHRMFIKMRDSCLKIQRAFRRYQSRKEAATTLQSYWRMHLARKSYKQKRAACVKIQTAVRCYQAQQEYLLKQGAALAIQRRYRAYLIGSLERMRYLQARDSCVLIQAHLRMQLQRRRYLRVRKSAVTLQCYMRALLKMRKQRREFLAKKKAAIKIQAVYRGYKARQLATLLKQRKHLEEYMRLVRERQLFLQRQAAAVMIQKHFKGIGVRKWFLQKKAATLMIQRHFRGYLMMKTDRAHFLDVKAKTTVIQSVYRMHQAKKMMRVLKRDKEQTRRAAVVLQASFKTLMIRKDFLRKRAAACSIQRFYRGYLHSRRLQAEFRQIKESAVIVQSAYRVFAAKRVLLGLREERNRQQRASLMIQKHYRGFVARKDFNASRNAAIILQRVFRSKLLARKLREEYVYKRNCVLKIQTIYRVHLARKFAQRLRDDRAHREAAAAKIQRFFRGYLTMKSCRAEFVAQKDAVIKIQRCFRKYWTKKMDSKIKAAVVIQRIYRSHRERVFSINTAAVIKIQAVYKGYRERCRYQKIKAATQLIQARYSFVLRRKRLARQQQAAIIIQRWYKACCVVKVQRRNYECVKSAALSIQSYWRGYQVRKNTANRKIIAARERIKSANSEATEPKKLCNRTKSALSYLLNCRNVSTIYEALKNLEVSTRLSQECCERLVEDNALRVIFQIVKNCNRGLPSINQIFMALCVLINLAKCPTTYMAIVEEKDSLLLLVDLMGNFREKKKVFPNSCTLLVTLCGHSNISQLVQSNSILEKKLKGLYSVISRKAAIDLKRNKTNARLQKNVNVKDSKDSVSIIDQMASLKQLMAILNWL